MLLTSFSMYRNLVTNNLAIAEVDMANQSALSWRGVIFTIEYI